MNERAGKCWMKSIGNHCIDLGRLLWLLFAFYSVNGVCALGQFGNTETEPKFALLQTKTGMYTNVTVTKMTKDWIFILHSSGVCNVKIEDLTDQTLIALGYEKPSTNGRPATRMADSPPPSHPFAPFAHLNLSRVKEFAADWKQNGRQRIKEKLDEMTASNPMTLYIMLAILAVTYIFVSTCFWLICRKTHSAPGPLVWVPILQLIPLLRAANMPRVWFFVYFVPVLNIIALIVWSIKICKSRGKSPFVAFLLILPPTSLFAFLYLAFSPSAPIVLKNTEILALDFA